MESKLGRSWIRVAIACAALGASSLAQDPHAVRADASPAGDQAGAPVRSPTRSADGRFEVFASAATELVPADTNGFAEVFLRDRLSGATSLLSVAADGTRTDGDSWSPSISADGRCVTFWSAATNLVPDDANGRSDLFLHDRSSGVTSRVTGAGVARPPFGVDPRADGRPWSDARNAGAAGPLLARLQPAGGKGLAERHPASTAAALAPPGDFLLTTPIDGAQVMPSFATGTFTLSWEASTGQDGYVVEISHDPSFVPMAYTFDVDASVTSHDVPSGQLQFFLLYYWQVRATNADGSTLATNAPFQVTMTAPPGGLPQPNPGNCFVATAAYGSTMEPDVATLRAFRDRVLLPTTPGRAFVAVYYATSPPLAAAIAERPDRRAAARVVLWPLVRTAEAALWGLDHPVGAGALACAVLALALLLRRAVCGR